MAQPLYRDSVTTGYQADYSPTVPIETLTHSEGDWLWLLVMDDNATVAINTPSGWTAGIDVYQAQGCNSRWFYKTAGASESNFDLSLGGNSNITHLVAVNPNGATIAISDQDSSDAASDTSTTPTLTGVASCLVLCGFVNDDPRTVSTPPASMTQMELDESVGQCLASYYQQLGAGDFTKSLVWSAAGGVHAHGVVLYDTAAASGLSIPVAMNYYAQQ